MEKKFIVLTKENIEYEHICCAFSDKKCATGYNLKKEWLRTEINNGYIFRKLNERAKVFIEYISAEKAWAPIDAPNYLMINCFWVSGRYKGNGYGKALLQSAIEDAKTNNKAGLVTIVGFPKFHFMNDTKWLLKQGFQIVEKLPNGFSLLALVFNPESHKPTFKKSVIDGCVDQNGIVVYYSNRCPFTEYYINDLLRNTALDRNIPLTIIKIETMEQAQVAPTPATIFSLFFNGKFITTDISACIGKQLDKLLKI